MTCAELYDRLTERAEGTLPADLCAEVDAHLATCGECQLVRQDLEDLARLCREVPAPTVMPDDVRQRIEVLLSNPDQAPSRPRV